MPILVPRKDGGVKDPTIVANNLREYNKTKDALIVAILPHSGTLFYSRSSKSVNIATILQSEFGTDFFQNEEITKICSSFTIDTEVPDTNVKLNIDELIYAIYIKYLMNEANVNSITPDILKVFNEDRTLFFSAPKFRKAINEFINRLQVNASTETTDHLEA